jgi:hypothetical protein
VVGARGAALKRSFDRRVAGGGQYISDALSLTSLGRVPFWRWAHTAASVLDADDRATLAAIENAMARLDRLVALGGLTAVTDEVATAGTQR